MNDSLFNWDALKRFLDCFFGTVLLVGLSPFLALIATLNLLFQGRPIFFVQVRTGIHGRPFKIIKFRTMGKSEGPGSGDRNRIGKYAHLLRSTSIDELPTLVNVVKGEMSFVGPRPLLREYDELYSPRHRRRMTVRPGLTGLAQVSGRNGLSWNERLEFDIAYVDSRSLALDLRIVVKTMFVIVSARSINHDPLQTMYPLTKGYWLDSSQ